ncbi:hypothetical protein LCGC14_0131980, partial [marine sediment metagenome]
MSKMIDGKPVNITNVTIMRNEAEETIKRRFIIMVFELVKKEERGIGITKRSEKTCAICGEISMMV